MNLKSNLRPRCPRCGGPLTPEKAENGRVISVGCMYCGERISRDYPRRFPTPVELEQKQRKGVPGHGDGRKRA